MTFSALLLRINFILLHINFFHLIGEKNMYLKSHFQKFLLICNYVDKDILELVKQTYIHVFWQESFIKNSILDVNKIEKIL